MWRTWTPVHWWWEYKIVQLLWKTWQQLPKKLNIEISHDPEILLLDIHSKELKARIQIDICAPMFIAALFTIDKRWKQPKCSATDERVVVHTMEYYSALKRNGIQIHVTTRMNCKNIMLSEISQTQKEKNVWFHSYGISRIVKQEID